MTNLEKKISQMENELVDYTLKKLDNELIVLFSLELTKFERQLKTGNVNKKLAEAFVYWTQPLSDNAKISQKGTIWEISDANNTYIIANNERDKLNVYKSKNPIGVHDQFKSDISKYASSWRACIKQLKSLDKKFVDSGARQTDAYTGYMAKKGQREVYEYNLVWWMNMFKNKTDANTYLLKLSVLADAYRNFEQLAFLDKYDGAAMEKPIFVVVS